MKLKWWTWTARRTVQSCPEVVHKFRRGGYASHLSQHKREPTAQSPPNFATATRNYCPLGLNELGGAHVSAELQWTTHPIISSRNSQNQANSSSSSSEHFPEGRTPESPLTRSSGTGRLPKRAMYMPPVLVSNLKIPTTDLPFPPPHPLIARHTSLWQCGTWRKTTASAVSPRPPEPPCSAASWTCSSQTFATVWPFLIVPTILSHVVLAQLVSVTISAHAR